MRLKAIALFTILICTLTVLGQNTINTDTCNYTFDVYKTNTINSLTIKSLHTDINVYNWEKDSISIESTVKILSKKQVVVEELLGLIKVNNYVGKSGLVVNTRLDPEFASTVPYHIVINVFIPKHKKLFIKNSHGKVALPTIDGSVDLQLNYCDVKINDIRCENQEQKNNLKLSFCKGSIINMGDAALVSNSSEITIKNSETLSLLSEYSTLIFQKNVTLEGSSNMDKVKIETSNNINIKGNNSYIDIENIENNAQFELIKGQLQISNTSKKINTLQVSNKNTITNIHLNPYLPFIIHGEIENGEITHAYGNHITVMRESNKVSFSGTIGDTSSQPAAKVILFNEGQSINLK